MGIISLIILIIVLYILTITWLILGGLIIKSLKKSYLVMIILTTGLIYLTIFHLPPLLKAFNIN